MSHPGRAVLSLVLLLGLASVARADLGDVDTALGEISFDEVRISPEGNRVAFVTRRNDLAHDRETFELWQVDGEAARPVSLLEAASCSLPTLVPRRPRPLVPCRHGP
jgi:hypothetical protein